MSTSDEIIRVRILGVPVDCVDMRLTLKHIEELIQDGKKGNCVFALNAEKFMALGKDPYLRQVYETAALLVPDGVGATWGLRWQHRLSVERVSGADLMQRLCKLASEKGYKIFLYGAREEVNKKSVEKLRMFYPSIRIVGRCNGYVAEDKMEELVREINQSKADILFVALGSPKQEEWIKQYIPGLNVKICQAIGGTLDVIAGQTRRAPRLFQKLALEWLYRLITDPKRIRRQAIYPLFLFRLFMQKRAPYSV